MKKKLKKISLFAGLLGLCGAFGLSLLLLDHNKDKSTESQAYTYITELEMSGTSHSTISGYKATRFNGVLEKDKLISSLSPSNWYLANGTFSLNYYMNYTTLMADFVIDIPEFSYRNGNTQSSMTNNSSPTSFSYTGIEVANNMTIANFTLTLDSLTNITGNQYYIPMTLWFYNPSNHASLKTFTSNLTFGGSVADLPQLISATSVEDCNCSLYASIMRDYGISEYNLGYNDGSNGSIQEAYENGYNAGMSDGWTAGMEQGTILADTYFNNGYEQGYNEARDFYESNEQNVHQNGYNQGYGEGYSQGKQDGINSMGQDLLDNYQEGYVAGYNEASSQDSAVTSIFSGILQVAMVPVNFFLAIFNFEILGINLSGFIRALFTIAITIIVIRTIFGGKGASDS